MKPELKLFFFERHSQPVKVEELSLELIESGIKRFSQNLPVNGLNLSYGVYQITDQALSRKKITGLTDLNLLLTKILLHHLKTTSPFDSHEKFIKKILKSPHLTKFSGELFKLILESWVRLIYTTQDRLELNKHHQTRKRLERLNLEYISLRRKFRKVLGTKTNKLSILDSFLLG